MYKALRQNTAVTINLGGVVYVDGSPYTSSIADADIRLMKNGSAPATRGAISTSSTHDWGGHHRISLGADDVNTIGLLRVAVYVAPNGSSMVSSWEDFIVISQTVYDALIANNTKLPVNLVQILGVIMTDPSSGRIADSFEHFFGNSDIDANKTINDIASGVLDGSIYVVASNGTLNQGIQVNTWESTKVLDSSNYWQITSNGSGIDAELEFTGVASKSIQEFYGNILFNGGGNRVIYIQAYNNDTTSWDLITSITHTYGFEVPIYFKLNSDDYTDASGKILIRFLSSNTANGDFVKIGYCRANYIDIGAQIPTLLEIIDGVNNEIDSRHGFEKYQGLDQINTSLDTINSQTEFTIYEGPSIDDAINLSFVMIQNPADKVWYGRYISDYASSTKTITINEAFGFTITEEMFCRIVVNIPSNVNMIANVPFVGANDTKIAPNMSVFYGNDGNDTTRLVDNVGGGGLVKLDPTASENHEAIIRAIKNVDASTISETVDSILDNIKKNVLTKNTLFGPLSFDLIVRGLFAAQFGKQARIIMNPEEEDLTQRIEKLLVYDYDNSTIIFKMKIENLEQTRIFG